MKPVLIFTICFLIFIILYNSYVSSRLKEGFLTKLIGPHIRPYVRDLDSLKANFKNKTYDKLTTYYRKIGL